MSHKVVCQEDWIKARKELLAEEKEFTRLRDELSRKRRALPWYKIEKEYSFEGPEGVEKLVDLFQGRSQLIIYHFMFDPDWKEGCKSCSFIADHYEPAIVHLEQRDVSMVTISRAPLSKLSAFKKRMGWTFKWLSSFESDFNTDFNVTGSVNDEGKIEGFYNYKEQPFVVREAPGISVFRKDEAGNVYHAYSSFSRGLDMFLGTYHLLDITPEGRNEENLVYPMEWVRHHDRYGDDSYKDMYVELFTGNCCDKE